ILDWYDQYHCYQDANRDPAGIDRLKGRLYRVRYKDAPRRAGFDLAKSSEDDLIGLLASPNVYDRDIAQRLLTERASPEIRGKLEALVLDAKLDRKARMHGLWALISSGPLDPGFHAKLLTHPDATFRAWGVRAAGNMGQVEPAIRESVFKLVADPSPDVRLQVVIAARRLLGHNRLPLLLDVQRQSYQDPLIPFIVWQSLRPLLDDRPGEFARSLKLPPTLGSKRRRFLDGVLPFLVDRLLTSPGADAEYIARLTVEGLADDETCREAFDTVATHLREHDLPAELDGALRRSLRIELFRLTGDIGHPLYPDYVVLLAYCGDEEGLKRTRAFAASRSPRRLPLRLRAIEALMSLDPPEKVHPFIQKLLTEAPASLPIESRERILDLLGDREDPGVGPLVVGAYPKLDEALKPRAIELLTERPAWTKALLAAVAEKKVATSALNVTQLRQLQHSKDPEIARQVKSIWGTIRERRAPGRERVVSQVKRAILQTAGDPIAGQAVFDKLCAQCHRIHGKGQDVGPDLTSNGRNDFDQLVSNVFDPSLVIGPGYQATTIAMTDGRVLTGLLVENGKDRLVLKVQGGKVETLARDQVDQIRTAEVSLMPEEIEKQLTPREIADLFAFLCLDRPPTDPTARSLPGSGPIERRSR
ncbi:MAG: c-type cytochrome, partial [Isosphaeraceae bacterium]